MAKSFDDLVKKTTSKQVRARAQQRAQEMWVAYQLAELRKFAGQSQQETARSMRITQPSLSKLEQQKDMQVSTLKKLVSALGGELQMFVRFPNQTIPIGQFNHV